MLLGVLGLAGSGKDEVGKILVKHHGFVRVALADVLKRICQDAFEFTDEQLYGPSALRNSPDMRYPRDPELVRAYDDRRRLADSYEADGHPDKEMMRRYAEDTKKRAFLSPRHALQQLGSEWGRVCYPDVWVEYVIRIYKRLQEGGCYYDHRKGLCLTSAVESDAVRPKINVIVTDTRFHNEVVGLRKHGGKVWRLIRPGAGLQGQAGQHVSETEQASMPDDLFDAVIQNDGSLEDLAVKVTGVLVQQGIRDATAGYIHESSKTT
jgi:hypothetical protein